MDTKTFALLATLCLAVMVGALAFTIQIFLDYEIRQAVAVRIYNPFSVTIVGLYIFAFLLANALLVPEGPRRWVWLIAPVALLAGWAIVAGPFYGWTIQAGIAVSVLFSVVLGFGSFLSLLAVPFAGFVIGPLFTGCLTGLAVHGAGRILAGQPIRGRAADREALAHCLGFVLGANLVLWTVDGIDEQLALLRDHGAGPSDYVVLLWPIYLAAPALHLACVWAARLRWGWSPGATRLKPIIKLGLVLFLITGIGRGVALKDDSLLFAWPARELHALQIWKQYPKRGTPFEIGGHALQLDDATRIQRDWNPERGQYDQFHFDVAAVAWPIADRDPSRLEVRLREAHPPYLPVACDDAAEYGLLRCRPVAETAPQDRRVPPYWITYDYEIYAVPDRPYIVLGRAASGTPETRNLTVAASPRAESRISMLMALYRFEVTRWREATTAFDRVRSHHIRPRKS